MQSQETKIKIIEQIRQVMRLHHYSIHTERTYLDWMVVNLCFLVLMR
jgi:hypothetical protein